jgi:hypothetical protein
MPTLSINYTTTEIQRMAKGFGSWQNLGRDATQEEVRQATMAWQKSIVFDQEHKQAVDGAVATVPPPDPFNPT